MSTMGAQQTFGKHTDSSPHVVPFHLLHVGSKVTDADDGLVH